MPQEARPAAQDGFLVRLADPATPANGAQGPWRLSESPHPEHPRLGEGRDRDGISLVPAAERYQAPAAFDQEADMARGVQDGRAGLWADPAGEDDDVALYRLLDRDVLPDREP